MTNKPLSAGRRIVEVASTANPLLKTFRRSIAEGVTRQGWLAVEGPFLIEEALRAGHHAHIHSVLVSNEGLERLKTLVERLPAEAEVARVSDDLFRRVADTEAPQGIAALVELKRPSLEAVLRQPRVLLVVACGLQDPGNLGTIHRSAQAFGAHALMTLEATVSPFNPKAMRASAGAVFHVPSFAGAEPVALFKKLRAARVRLIAADPRCASRLTDVNLLGPLAILIGQEAAGLSPEIAGQADLRVCIPLRAGMDSLNAATAASIFLYETARQRDFRYDVIL
jgi:TrmH family RNA methyltransferase